MYIKFPLIVIFIVFSYSAFCQTGTLIIGTITQNEILLAADSRAIYYESDDHTIPPIAYYDSVCKIYRLKQFAIGIAGAYAIGEIYYYEIINDYNKTQFTDTSLYNTLQIFLLYLNNRFPKDSFPEITSNKFILGGYVNNKPQLIAFRSSENKIIQLFSGTIGSDSHVLKYAVLNTNKEGTVYQKLENTIYDYAKEENRMMDIGGPISIISIVSGNKIMWKQNNFSNRNYKSLEDFYNAVKFDKVKMNYLVPNGKERLLKIMRH